MKLADMKKRFALKAFKHAKFASHETECFEAKLALDGKVIGEARNEGCGGPTFVHFKAGFAIPDMTPAEIEEMVDDLVAAELDKKEEAKFLKKLKKDFATAILFTKKGIGNGRYWIAKYHPIARPYEVTKAGLLKDPEVGILLNEATDEAILAHFKG
jgi:hypothetical protein